MKDERATPKNIEVSRWVKKGKHWKLETESVTPAKYVERFKELRPWYKGARIRSSISNSSSILAKEIQP
jgi:hypothetical protein